jgi:hypothetical protein
VSTGHLMCGFVPMRGAGEHRGTSVPLLGDGVVGLWQDEGDAVAIEELAGVLDGPRAEMWTGVTIAANASSADLDLWLATTLPRFCLMTARQEAIDDGTVSLSWRYGTARTSPTVPGRAPSTGQRACTSSGRSATARTLAGPRGSWRSRSRPGQVRGGRRRV